MAQFGSELYEVVLLLHDNKGNQFCNVVHYGCEPDVSQTIYEMSLGLATACELALNGPLASLLAQDGFLDFVRCRRVLPGGSPYAMIPSTQHGAMGNDDSGSAEQCIVSRLIPESADISNGLIYWGPVSREFIIRSKITTAGQTAAQDTAGALMSVHSIVDGVAAFYMSVYSPTNVSWDTVTAVAQYQNVGVQRRRLQPNY